MTDRHDEAVRDLVRRAHEADSEHVGFDVAAGLADVFQRAEVQADAEKMVTEIQGFLELNQKHHRSIHGDASGSVALDQHLHEPRRAKWQGYRTIFAVDAIGSTKWTNGEKQIGRALLYRVVGDAFEACGIKPHYCDPLVDRGDGLLALIRPLDEVPKRQLLGDLVPKLRELLTDQGDTGLRTPLRLRAVLHAGEVHDDGIGPFSEALDSAFRLLESIEFKRFDEADSPLSLVLSEDIYRTVVLQYFPNLALRFRQMRKKDARNGNVYKGWVLT